MNFVRHDDSFNINEWSVLIGFAIGLLVMWLLPRRFPIKKSIVYFMIGATTGFFFDHTLSVIPVDFYDVNDTSQIFFIDAITYFTYGPVGYLFFYFYDRLKITLSNSPIYVLGCALCSMGVEWLAHSIGVFHYKHGYSIAYSFPIYLLVLTTWVGIHHLVRQIQR